MSDTPEEDRILKIAAFGFDRPEEAPLDDFPCCSDTELHERNSEAAQGGGPARIQLCPPSPETSRRYFEVYCPVCKVHECLFGAGDPRLLQRQDEHNAGHGAGWRPPVPADHPTEPKCTCLPVGKPWTYYGIAEPGGAMEPNPECPEHFPTTNEPSATEVDVTRIMGLPDHIIRTHREPVRVEPTTDDGRYSRANLEAARDEEKHEILMNFLGGTSDELSARNES